MLRYMLDTGISSYVKKGSEPTAMERLMALPVGDVCISAITKAELKQGTMIGANDLFIAAHARCLGLVLVTNNTRE